MIEVALLGRKHEDAIIDYKKQKYQRPLTNNDGHEDDRRDIYKEIFDNIVKKN